MYALPCMLLLPSACIGPPTMQRLPDGSIDVELDQGGERVARDSPRSRLVLAPVDG